MKCPICGAKMKYGACQYCKITEEQVINASNKAVSKARRDGRKTDVYYSTTLPSDINRMRLILITIFLGWVGADSFYVKRPFKGLYPLVSICVCLVLYAVGQMAGNLGLVFRFFYEMSFYCTAIALICWVYNIIALFTKNYKVPVVLAEKEDISIYKLKSRDAVVEKVNERVIKEETTLRTSVNSGDNRIIKNKKSGNKK